MSLVSKATIPFILLAFFWSEQSLSGPINIQVRHVISGRPLLLDSLRYPKFGNEIFSVKRLSYLLSDVSFQKEDGTWIGPVADVAWIDAGKRRVTFLVNDLPKGKYRSMRFVLGLDSKKNNFDFDSVHPDHPLNPSLNKLHWSWQGGYVFLALEGHYRVSGKRRGYSLHFARSANRKFINVPLKIDHGSATRIILDFDMTSLLSTPRPIIFSKDGESTHSRKGDPLVDSISKNLARAFRLRDVVYPNQINEPKIEKKVPLYFPDSAEPFPFKMARTFPVPKLPTDNPLIKSRVRLGEKLFSDNRLSRDSSIACSSCHQKDKAFTDGLSLSVGIEDRKGKRNSMPLFNLAWKENFFWDGRAPSLRDQVLMPISSHAEFDNSLKNAVIKLSQNSSYPPLFEKAFNDPEITSEKIALALENFLLTLTSYDSKFDRAMAGQIELDDKEKRGFELFMTEYEPRTGRFGADCFHCHGGPLFSDHEFHNNGLKLKSEDSGMKGLFSTPSLRNIELTGPYMHDGRFSTLEEVVSHYNSAMHRTDVLDPNLAKHPVQGLRLAKSDEQAIVAFLKTLTDPKYQDTP
ncbi:MAG: MbnP family protein [Verrucomicrobiota bacterium]|nr:MbnP family protein [Verrucomicrobiota bacterium]